MHELSKDYATQYLIKWLSKYFSEILFRHQNTDAIAFSNAHFGTGTGDIFLDGLGCTGSESSLLDCSKSSTITCTYGHNEDAGVRCHG